MKLNICNRDLFLFNHDLKIFICFNEAPSIPDSEINIHKCFKNLYFDLNTQLYEEYDYFIYLSDVNVFNGNLKPTRSYTEKSRPNPINFYGHTQLCCENLIKKVCRNLNKKYLIVRTSYIYNDYSENLITYLLRTYLNDPYNEFRVFKDQYFNPTSFQSIIDQLHIIVSKEENIRSISSIVNNVINISTSNNVSLYDFAVKFFNLMNMRAIVRPILRSSDKDISEITLKNGCLLNTLEKFPEINIMKSWDEDLTDFVTKSKLKLMEYCIK